MFGTIINYKERPANGATLLPPNSAAPHRLGQARLDYHGAVGQIFGADITGLNGLIFSLFRSFPIISDHSCDS